MKSRLSRQSKAPGLMLTSLLDMFTIILIFLIVSFEAESKEFKLNPDLVLPESKAQGQLQTAVNLAITKTGIVVDEQTVASLTDGELSADFARSGTIDGVIKALEAEYKKRYGSLTAEDTADVDENSEEAAEKIPIIVVQADEGLKYRTLYAVLRSAAQAGFFKYRLALLKA